MNIELLYLLLHITYYYVITYYKYKNIIKYYRLILMYVPIVPIII